MIYLHHLQLNKQYYEQQNIVDKAEEVYFRAKLDNLSGDPIVDQYRSVWDTEREKLSNIGKEISTLLGLNVPDNVSTNKNNGSFRFLENVGLITSKRSIHNC